MATLPDNIQMPYPDLASILNSVGCRSNSATIASLQEKLSACIDCHLEAAPPGSETFSRLGGSPWLPPDLPHPSDLGGKPMPFVAQINFAELPQAGFDRADRGLFMLFCNPEKAHANPKDRHAFQCIWLPDPQLQTFRQSDFTDGAICPHRSLRFSTGWSLPEYASAWQDSSLEPAVCEKVAEKLAAGRQMQLFGQAGKQFDLLQEKAAFAGNGITWNTNRRQDSCFSHLMAAAADWRLFMQIKAAPELGFHWQNCSLYLLIKKEDLAGHNYARSWLLLA
jgi:uncharacterized protein YwqG